MSNRLAILEISMDDLIGGIALPIDIDLKNCRVSFDKHGVVELLIEGKDFAEVKEGNVIPRVKAIYEEGDFLRFE